MTRYYLFPLLLSALTAQASDVTTTRWQGQWGDGIRDAPTLTPIDAGQMKVHYWRKLDADYRKAALQIDAIATVARTEPLTLDVTDNEGYTSIIVVAAVVVLLAAAGLLFWRLRCA